MEDRATKVGGEALDWQGHVEATLVTHWRRRAESAYRALSRAAGTQGATLESMLLAIESGEGETLRARLAPARFPADGYQVIVLTAAFDSGVFRVRMNREGPALLERADGTEFDAEPLAKALEVAEAATVPQLRGMLAEAGIELARAAGGTTDADAETATALGALSHMKLDAEPHDLVLTDTGLLFVPCPTAVDKGRERLRRLLTTPDGVAGIARLPGAHWLPFEELATVWILKDSPVKARVTRHDGGETEFGWTWIGEEIGDSSRLLLERLRALAGPEE